MSPALLMALAVLVAPRPGGLERLGHRKRLAGLRSRSGSRMLWLPAAAVAVVSLVALPLPVTLAGAAVVGTAGLRWRRSRRAAERVREAQTLQGALGILVGELRAGAHPVAAFDAAAYEVDGPVAAALGEVAARARLGADVSAGLRAVAGSSAKFWHARTKARALRIAGSSLPSPAIRSAPTAKSVDERSASAGGPSAPGAEGLTGGVME